MPSSVSHSGPTESRPKIAVVVAVGRNGVIGQDGDLPWSLPNDLRWFKQQTLGKPVIMGRRTYLSIGRPLPRRRNIVLTRSRWPAPDGVETAPDLDTALALTAEAPEVAVIGGAGVFADALPLADRLIWTAVDAAPDGDTMMPPVDWGQWIETFREAHQASDTAPAHVFLEYQRRTELC